jgi:hypothetical protein
MRARGVAAITALLFVACGMLAMRHEASTPHLRDRAGGFVHAPSLIGHHAGRDADIHGQRNPDAETECTVLTAFHQAASGDFATLAVVAHAPTLRAHEPLRAAHLTAVTDVYRLAPKTSPPVAA